MAEAYHGAMERHFDPVTLRLFVAVCEEGNIARAAAREALVASAVSKRIGAVEQQVGTPLLVRGRRGIEPTPAGQALLRQARDVLGAMARMHAELSEFASGVQGSVRMVASISALAEWLPEDVAAFITRHPAVRVSLDEITGAEAVRQVREGAADIGVTWDAVDSRGLRVLPYRCDHLGVVMPQAHPLAGRKRLRFADTLDHDWITTAPGGLIDTMLRRHAARLGRTITPRIQVTSIEASTRIAAAGLGLALLPLEAVASQVAAARLIVVPLHEPWARRNFLVVTRDDEWLSAASRALATHLSDVARDSA
jgi:DNA-binding transcriptional LysR family regulator